MCTYLPHDYCQQIGKMIKSQDTHEKESLVGQSSHEASYAESFGEDSNHQHIWGHMLFGDSNISYYH